jgi:GNAT superfamily N-acetyltransferase
LIRHCEPADAKAVGALALEFQSYLRSLGDQTEFAWGAAEFLRDGFGDHPAFEGLVAEVDSGIVGYLLYDFGYDTDRGQRLLYVIDLYVAEACRRQGIGRALMDRAVQMGRARGAELLLWPVYEPNKLAVRFYEKLGARPIEGLRFMSLVI